MTNILESIKETWGKLSRPMQIGVAVFVLGVFISLLLLVFFNKTDYSVLFADLSPEDAGSVVNALQERGVPYRLTESGTTVLVPQNEVFETRIALATAGMPTGGVVGFEIFNATRLGETEADRNLRYQRALQGELTRTVRQMDEIMDARIHIVLPKRSLFIQESQASTATVLLQIKPGVKLTKGQVHAIANLVSTSVEGLTPENVTIVDTRGNVLNAPAVGDLSGGFLSDRFETEWMYEKQLEDSITAMLERIYGFGNVVVRVSASLDFDHFEEYSEVFSPVTRDTGLPRSEQRFEESFRGTTATAGGVPGVDSNVPGYVFADQEAGSSEYERFEETINYELNRTETRLRVTPGQVTSLSASVWLNGEYTAAQLAAVEESIRRAVGFQTERGDSIYVAGVPFETSPFLTEVAVEEAIADGAALWFAAAAMLIMIAGIIIYLYGRRRRAAVEEMTFLADMEVAADEETPVLTPEEKERRTLRQDIQTLAKEKPEEVALLVKTWLADE